MEELTAEFSVEALCAVLEVSRSGYYKWRERRPRSRPLSLQKAASMTAKLFFPEKWQRLAARDSPR